MTEPQPAPVYIVRPAPVTNGTAIAALVLGIIAAASALIPLAGFFLLPIPALLAIILGIVGLNRSKQLNGLNRVPAIVGIVLGAASGPIAIVVVGMVRALGSLSQ